MFILKIENILRNINFETASFHVNSSIGDYILTWEKLMESQKIKSDRRNVFITEDWSFKITFDIGSQKNDIKDLESMNFRYPIKK